MQRRINRVDKYYNTSSQPIDAQRKSPIDRRYSLEEVKDWCQRMLQSKLKYLHRQIAQNNQTIRTLNQRLKQAQRDFEKKQRQLQGMTLHAPCANRAELVEISNKLLNDKLREKFEDINQVISSLEMNKHQMAKNTRSEVQNYQFKMEERINRNIFQLKASLKEKCEDIKKNNSLYWNKIKNWAKMFQEKITKCDNSVGHLLKQSDRLEETINTSVMGLYKLKSFNTRFKEVEMAIYDLEESFKVISETQLELKELVQGNNKVQLSYSKDDFTYRFEDFAYKPDDQYQFGTFTGTINKKQAIPQTTIKYEPSNNRYEKLQARIGDTKYTDKYDTKLDTKYEPSNSRYQQTIKYEGLSTSLKPPTSPPPKSSSPGDFSILSKSLGLGEFAHHDVSRASSFKSMAASQTSQSRKQMMVDLRKRLQMLIEQKKLPMPVVCFLDEINYLKNSYNNYIFDCRGNMFKMKKEEFDQLCAEGLLKKV